MLLYTVLKLCCRFVGMNMEEVSSESSPPSNIPSDQLSYSILNNCSVQIRTAYRNCERMLLRITSVASHLSFNETCVNNDILPIYTNVNLHNEAVRGDTLVHDFRYKLIAREIEQQQSQLSQLRIDYQGLLGSLESETQNETELEALKALLGRNQQKKLDELREKHTRKLVNIYGPSILLKQQRDSVINLSDVAIEEELRKIMTLGINFHVKGKFEEKKRKVEVEVFYENVREKVRSNDLTIAEEDAFKCELERFGTKRVLDRTHDIITKDQYRKIKEFRSDPRIVIRKSDKGNNFVILNKQYYDEQMDEIVQMKANS